MTSRKLWNLYRRWLFDDPDLGPLRMQNVMFRMSETPGRIRFPGRARGSDNEEVYGELGVTPDDVRIIEHEDIRRMLLEMKARGASTATVHSWIWSAGADDPDYFDHGESAAELPDSLREAHYLALRWKGRAQDR